MMFRGCQLLMCSEGPWFEPASGRGDGSYTVTLVHMFTGVCRVLYPCWFILYAVGFEIKTAPAITYALLRLTSLPPVTHPITSTRVQIYSENNSGPKTES